MAQGLERIPLAVDSDFKAQPVRANFPDAPAQDFKLVAFEPDQMQAQPAPASLGVGDTLSSLGRNVWDAVVYHTPAAVAAAVEGDDPYATWDWKDALIDRARQRAQEVSKPGDANTKTAIPGITAQDINSLGPSAGFSASGAAAGLGAGIPAGMVASPVAGYAAGMAASGTAAYRMATNQFVRDLHDTVNAESLKATGKPVSPQEFQAKQAQLADTIKAYGLWEAVPEAAGNALSFGILTAPVKGAIGKLFGKNIATRFAGKLGALYGEELATETATQMGQHNAEVGAGMTKAPRREFTSPTDWRDSFKEVAGPTMLQTTLMAGGFKAGQMAKDRLMGEADQPDNAIPAGDIGAGPGGGGIDGEFIPAGPAPALANQPGGTTYDQSRPELPAGQTMLPRLALPAPEDGGPSERQVSTAIGLLKHSPKASPELLQRLMRVDQTMATMLFNHWQGQTNGQVTGNQATEIPAAGDQGQGTDIAGSRVMDGFSDGAVSFIPGAAAEDAALGGEPGMALGGAGPDAVTPLDVQAHAAATSPFNATPQPTEAQKAAGNYKVGRIKFQGMDISIENPAGSVRSGTDEDGKAWETQIQHHYGYIKGTVGKDKDHLDVFIKPGAQSARTAYVIDQINPKTGAFDEHKIVFGADSEADAQAIYHANYEQGWQGMGAITAMPIEQFKDWIKSGKTKKPVAYTEPKEVRTASRAPKTASSLLQAIVNRGGISREIMSDVGADPAGRYMPGLFTKTGTTDLSALAGYLFDEDGFHQIRQDSAIGPARELEDLIVRALGGEKVLSTTAMGKGAQAEETAKLKEKAQRLGVKTVARKLEDIAADVLRIEAQNVLDEETALEDEALVAYNETVDALHAAIGEDDAENFLEALASKYQDETHLNYLRSATADIQEKINEQALSAAAKPDEATGRAAEEGDGTGVAPGGDRASGEEARPSISLSGQSEAEIRAEQERVAAADAQRKAEDERAAAAERQARIDAEVAGRQDVAADNFTLTPQVNNKTQQKKADQAEIDRQLAGQGDIFGSNSENQPADPVAESPAPAPSEPGDDGVATIQGGAAADTIAGKPVSEMSDDQLRTIARGLSPTFGEAAVDKAKTELRRRDQAAKPARPYATPDDRNEAIYTLQRAAKDAGLEYSDKAIKDAAEFGASQAEIAAAIEAGEDAVSELASRYAERSNGLRQGFGQGNNDAALRAKPMSERDQRIASLTGRGLYELPEDQRSSLLKAAKVRSVDAFEDIAISDRREIIGRWIDAQPKENKVGAGETAMVAGYPVSGMGDKALAAHAQSSNAADRAAAMAEIERRKATVKDSLTPEKAEQQAEGKIDTHESLFDRLRDGTATLDEFKAGFVAVVAGKEAITAELSKLTKDAIFKRFPGLAYRYKTANKAEIVDAAYRDMASDFALGRSISYVLGFGGDGGYFKAITAMVERTTEDDLAKFAADVKAAKAERAERQKEAEAGMENPVTLDDYKRILGAKAQEIGEGATFTQARMAMTPEQRARFDELSAEKTRDERKARADQQKTEVRVAAATTEGQIVETKHTRTGEPLFVVKAAERVERDVYNQWNATAKRMGGWYSSFRGNGAVPGFQFKTRENADAFLQYLGGNVEQAKEAVQARRDAFDDDRSQSAVERLNEMADRLDEQAGEILSAERKTNTARRARFAANAEAGANAQQAMAATMRNIAAAIESGKAKFLDRVRQKVQIERMQAWLASAQYDEQRAKYPTYAEQEKHRGEKPTGETADYAKFPEFTAFRSDLARMGRRLLEIDGAKQLGTRLLKVADDVTTAYKKFAKENLHKVSTFRGANGEAAVFRTEDAAEAAIARSGFKGKATTISFKRGEHLVIMGPEMAKEAGLWHGDPDKRITLSPDFAEEIIAKAKGRDIGMPWTFEAVAADRARLKAMGIETPAEFRAALREFVAMREAPKAPDRVKELERNMIGRANDGLDFFPTPAETAQAMIDSAEIKEGMAVLEPSAGMGHIAERIRAAGVDPDVVEMASDRRELLEAKGFRLVGSDFMDMSPRGFTYGDVFRAPDGTLGVMRGSGGMGSNRVGLDPLDANGQPEPRRMGWYDRDELEGVEKRAGNSGYDRIIMNPPFSDRRDAQHVQHAYTLLKPGGRLVAIMGEGVFFGQDKKAQAFRDWLEEVGGTSEKLEEGTFLDPSLPVNTGVNARMVVIEKPDGATSFSIRPNGDDAVAAVVMDDMAAQKIIGGFRSNFPGANKMVAVPDFAALPAHVQQDARDQGGNEKNTKGVFDHRTGTIYIVAGNHTSEADVQETVFHEALGHLGIRTLLGKEFVGELNSLFDSFGGLEGLAKIAKDRGFGKEFASYVKGVAQARQKNPRAFTTLIAKAVLAEEVFAHTAQHNPRLLDRLKALVGKLRESLREHGLAKLADYGETDLLWMLQKAQVKLRTGQADGRGGWTVLMAAYHGTRSAVSPAPTFGAVDTESAAFKAWFGGSKVVDADGKPLKVYHGTPRDFSKFKLSKNGTFGRGIYLSTDTNDAEGFSYGGDENGDNIMPLYAAINRPYKIDFRDTWPDLYRDLIGDEPANTDKEYPSREQEKRIHDALVAAGHDGIEVYGAGDMATSTFYVAFRPEQIKSATSNTGSFDPSNPGILESRTTRPSSLTGRLGAFLLEDESLDSVESGPDGSGNLGIRRTTGPHGERLVSIPADLLRSANLNSSFAQGGVEVGGVASDFHGNSVDAGTGLVQGDSPLNVVGDGPANVSRSRRSNAATLESGKNGRPMQSTKGVSDLLIGGSLRAHLKRLVEIPGQRISLVEPNMVPSGKDLKIVGGVIQAIPIDMMDVFVSGKTATGKPFSNIPVFVLPSNSLVESVSLLDDVTGAPWADKVSGFGHDRTSHINTSKIRSIEQVVKRFMDRFPAAKLLQIKVVWARQDLPAHTVASENAEAVFLDSYGQVFLVASNIYGGDARAFQILLHECIGHFGLAQMMGDRFKGILKEVMRAARAKGEVGEDIYEPGHPDYATIEAVRLRYTTASDEVLAEEVLARMAETDPGRTLFGYVRAVVRQWLRDMARAAGITLDVTTAELNDLVAQASRYMRRGDGVAQGVDVDALGVADMAVGGMASKATGMESRRAPTAGQPQQPRTGILDTILRKAGGELAAKITGPAYDKLTAYLGGKVPEGIKAGMVSDYGLDESYVDRRTGMQTEQQKAARQTKTFVEGLMDLDRAQSRVAYQWLNNRGAEADRLMAQLPQESQQVLKDIKIQIAKLTIEAVRLGQLDAETASRNFLAYLHRSYAKYDLNTDDKTWKAERAKAIKILGDQYKGRGLKMDVDPDRIHSAPGWWQDEMKGKRVQVLKNDAGRFAFVAEGTAIPPNLSGYKVEGVWEIRARKAADRITLWRDFTQDERQMMGELDEAKYAVARTLFMMNRDIEVGRFHEWVADEFAKTPEEAEDEGLQMADASDSMMRAFTPDEWVTVPTAKIPGTGVFKYGALAGMVVPGPVWNDIRQISAGRFEPFGAAYASILRAWKLSKTALTPTTHVNNIMGNFVMADMHDVGARDAIAAVRLMVAAANGDNDAKAMLDRFEDSGATQGMFTTHELRKEVLEPLLQQLREEVGMADDEAAILKVSAIMSLALHGQFGEAWAGAKAAAKQSTAGRVTGAVVTKAQDYYQAEDSVFRLAAFLKSVDEGKTDLEAGKLARKAFLDYHINAPWINAMRGTAMPFIAFAYRAIPMLVETAARKPWKIAKYMLVAGGLNALAYAMLGADADEDKERAYLPDEKAGRLWGIVPKLIRMPWNRESKLRDGRTSSDPVFLDVRRWIPVGDVVDYGQDKTALPMIPQPLIPGGPMIMVAEFLVNKSAFTGKELTKETDTWVEKAAKVGGHFYKGFMPNVPIPYSGTWAGIKIDNAVKGKEDPLGRAYPVPEAIASGFGLKLERYPVDTLQRNAVLDMKGKLRELSDAQRQAARDYGRQGMTKRELDEKVTEIVGKKNATIEEYKVKERKAMGKTAP